MEMISSYEMFLSDKRRKLFSDNEFQRSGKSQRSVLACDVFVFIPAWGSNVGIEVQMSELRCIEELVMKPLASYTHICNADQMSDLRYVANQLLAVVAAVLWIEYFDPVLQLPRCNRPTRPTQPDQSSDLGRGRKLHCTIIIGQTTCRVNIGL